MLGNLSPFALILIGFIIGWIVEWVIDLWLRQRRTDARIAQLEEVVQEKDARLIEAQERARAAEERVEELEAELRELREEEPAPPLSFEETPGMAPPLETETIARDVSITETEVEAPGIEAGAPPVPSPVEQGDDLASIPGLGPAYARLLKESGVLTYEDLARLDESDVRALIRARPSWTGVDVGAWIAEARRRAGLEEVREEAVSAPSREEEREAAPSGPIESVIRDDLTRIKGIGRVYAGKLYAAGIFTFADLAALTEERLREIIQPREWQNIDLRSWIEQARALAAQEQGKHD
ncbi:MAG TPA: hypothetical protein G4O02_14730 [Caldilineae bacterium]|nr:hypothetical protein [Caldilineae bacterium]